MVVHVYIVKVYKQYYMKSSLHYVCVAALYCSRVNDSLSHTSTFTEPYLILITSEYLAESTFSFMGCMGILLFFHEISENILSA